MRVTGVQTQEAESRPPPCTHTHTHPHQHQLYSQYIRTNAHVPSSPLLSSTNEEILSHISLSPFHPVLPMFMLCSCPSACVSFTPLVFFSCYFLLLILLVDLCLQFKPHHQFTFNRILNHSKLWYNVNWKAFALLL